MASSSDSASIEYTDVLVLGSGIAGICAALEAADAGAGVIVLEGASGPGGASAQSGGEIYLGGGTGTQQAVGMDDTTEDMKAFLTAALGPNADEAKIEAYCDGAVEHHDWLLAHGLEFRHEVWDEPTWMPSTEVGLMWMGERAKPFSDLATPAARGHRPPQGMFAGETLMARLLDTAEKSGIDIRTEIKARSLVRESGDPAAPVCGVIATHFGEKLEFRAGAVIIATGGFVDNERMLEQWAPQQVGKGKVTDGHSDGSGIEMAMRAGAAVRRMHQTETALPVAAPLVTNGFLVDGGGRRFINEDRYPGLYSHAAVHHRPAPTWIIVDEDIVDAVPETELWGMRPTHVAETIEELARECGLPERGLADTLAEYNADAEAGEDRAFGKEARFLKPLTSPYGAFPTGNGMRKGLMGAESMPQGFTLGGLHTDLDSRVLDLAGEPIGGLFAAGRATHGLHGEGYISGTSLGDGSFFGRRAGRRAAEESMHG